MKRENRPYYKGKKLTDIQRDVISTCMTRAEKCRECICIGECERFRLKLGEVPYKVYDNITDAKGNRKDFWSFE